MLRLATHTDIPQLVTLMQQVKQESTWRDYDVTYDPTLLTPFLTERLSSPTSVCYLWDDPVDAFCGVSLVRMHLPPHLPIVFEWGWTGPKRRAVGCWRACTQWGLKHGAVLACRTHSIPGHNIIETLTWEKL